MINYTEALQAIERLASIDTTEQVNLDKSLGRVLSKPIVANVPSPAFTNSAMDGFAVIHKEAAAGPLTVRESIFARPTTGLPSHQTNTCVKIMTGAPVPDWADTVVPVENTELVDGKVSFTELSSLGSNIRRKAEDIPKGAEVLLPGTFLDPERIMVAASFGYPKVEVFERPNIGIFTTGDELVMPGQSLQAGSIYNSSRFFLESAFERLGLTPGCNQPVADDQKKAQTKISKFMEKSESSLIVTTGAVSAGEKDFIPALAHEMGFEALFHKVYIRPGKPIFFAKKGRSTWVGLAGNAISTAVGFHFFIRPLLNSWLGIPKPTFVDAVLDADVRKPKHLRCFFRARVENNIATVYSRQGSSHLDSSKFANAYVELDEGTGLICKGTTIKALIV